MKRAGVPVLPGSEGTGVTELREAQVDAKRLGYPVLIKAAAGGGGKGMRVVRNADELTRLFALAQGESEASFSSKKMYLEKYLATRFTLASATARFSAVIRRSSRNRRARF
jgi:acetyl-CoA carboxylase biotin carboxylase subunit